MDQITALLDAQDGVIARRQALAAGMSANAIRRKLRRHEWVQVHPGVYINHTGHLSWRQRAWAAVLLHWPAALAGRSAIRAHEGPGRRDFDANAPIEVMVPATQHPDPVAGIRVRRSRRFDEAVQLHLGPPRQRYDDAVLELADREPSELRAIAALADACGSRRTTATRLLDHLAAMSRMTRRTWLTAILNDITQGTCSVLEHAYLTRVERPHGLPTALRQVHDRDTTGRSTYRDVVYTGHDPPWTQYVELDGRLGHDSTPDRDRDMERDLDAALDHIDTVRLGYGQVLDRPCTTAAKVGHLLRARGWTGTPTTCPACRAA